MTIININKKSFEKEIGKLDEVMLGKIAMFGTPVDSFDDDELVDNFAIEVFPNRPDLLSYQGFKRSFLAYLDKKGKTGLIDYSKSLKKPAKDYEVIVDKSLEGIRPYTACAIVKNLQLSDSRIKEIIDIQEKLHTTLGRKRKKAAIGIYPIEKISLPITFKALEGDKIKFVPLDSPGEKEMTGLSILQRHPTGRDYAHLLAGKEKFPIFVDAKENILSMPPIINSNSTGKVTNETRDVFIECSGFDFEILKKILNIVVTTLADFSDKVEIYQMNVHYGKKKEITPDLKPEKMKLNIENVNKLLGLNLNSKQLRGFLERMGYSYNEKKREVLIPAYRNDLLHEVDLIEDVAIAYGYDNFDPIIPAVSTIGSESKNEIIKRKISEIINGAGFIEISNYHLTTRDDQFKKMNVADKEIKDSVIEVNESKTEYNILRNDLSHFALKILSENVDASYPQKIYEMGRVFNLDKESNSINEKEKLCLAYSPANYTDVKRIIESLFRMMKVEIEIKEPESGEALPSHFIEGRIAKILIDNEVMGHIGEVHPKILKNWKLKMAVAMFEIDLEKVFEKI
ncbi:phenylalanine--tRNA ligase subunit beta [Candidatus Pacearchaeota archaeon CG10_big_fil_rev_8_21_14_0_10_32_14]|nr:MAG: phenylalanine--tRNA ligase subunit beta [Candidatus Pacearchaeota archaeon CG10_big_fil_rev_8_21_14_0_10_32_14]